METTTTTNPTTDPATPPGLIRLVATFDAVDDAWWLDDRIDDTDPNLHDAEHGRLVIVAPADLWHAAKAAAAAHETTTHAVLAAAGVDHARGARLVHPCAKYDGAERHVRIGSRMPGGEAASVSYWPVCAMCGHERDAHQVVG